jgi:hypothetical protein
MAKIWNPFPEKTNITGDNRDLMPRVSACDGPLGWRARSRKNDFF